MGTDEFTKKRIKKKLTGISSKIADAVEMTEEMEKLGAVSGIKLKQAQNEVSELYISIEDDAEEISEKTSEDADNGPNKKET